MHSKLAVTHFRTPPYSPIPCRDFCKFGVVAKNSSRHYRKLVCFSSGDNKWKLSDIDTNAVQERLSSWLSKTRTFFNEVNIPRVKSNDGVKLNPGEVESQEMEDIFVSEQTIKSKTLRGTLSLASIISIEQFSRLNGMTGEKMQKIFREVLPKSMLDDARLLVEYCCFRFLSRDSSDFHPCLKDIAFQRLIFITMLAWENPYHEENVSYSQTSEKASFQKKLVHEEAFSRFAPVIAGVADRSTVHVLLKALAGNEGGISLSLWCTYINELVKVHEGLKAYQMGEYPELSGERIACIRSSRKQPVLKWENNLISPGKLTLTNKALYFESVGLTGKKKVIKLDLTAHGSRVEKTKVGPLGSALFDSAVSVSSGNKSETWVLEFVDLGGEMRRDIWHASIGEVINLYKFINEYGPVYDDQSFVKKYGADKGKQRAISSTRSSILRLQALQFIRKLLEDPTKLVQLSYLQNAPYGFIVFQTLAVNYWGSTLVSKFTEISNLTLQEKNLSDGVLSQGINNHVFDIDGSVYLRKWMRSPTWNSSVSINFWKNSSVKHGIVLSKNLVVGDTSLVERAAMTCKDKYLVVEKTQATIDAAMIKGIPSNIDLFQELILPVSTTAKYFDKLRRWEQPYLTLCFLVFANTIIFRNLLPYIFPTTLAILAVYMLLLKGLKEQGRLGRSFGKVTIHDQPPSNTIQMIMAVKEAMLDVEKYIQSLNVSLLKFRAIVLSGQPQVTTEVALVLLSCAAVLLIVPIKYVLSFLLFDTFTRKLEFRREMVEKFNSILKDRWDSVPAAPVIILPFESEETRTANERKKESDKAKLNRIQGSFNKLDNL